MAKRFSHDFANREPSAVLFQDCRLSNYSQTLVGSLTALDECQIRTITVGHNETLSPRHSFRENNNQPAGRVDTAESSERGVYQSLVRFSQCKHTVKQ